MALLSLARVRVMQRLFEVQRIPLDHLARVRVMQLGGAKLSPPLYWDHLARVRVMQPKLWTTLSRVLKDHLARVRVMQLLVAIIWQCPVKAI